MKSKMVKLLITSIFISILVVSCTAPIELHTNDAEPVIVIYGCLTDETTWQSVRITSSSPYFDEKQNSPVSDAKVVIRSSDDQIVELKEESNGVYQTVEEMTVIPGVTYYLNVEVDFDHDGMVETYEASTTMPPPYSLDSISIEAINIMGYKHYALNMYGIEEPSSDFYLCRIIFNDSISKAQISNYMAFSDLGMNDVYINGLTLTYFEAEDEENPWNENVEGLLYVAPGDKIGLCISRIEEGYYNFIWQCQKEQNGENPFFGGPASNITTNISNGGVGYFTSFATSVSVAYVP